MIFNNHAKVDVFIEITKYKENILYIADSTNKCNYL